jgi:hypothetical protein
VCHACRESSGGAGCVSSRQQATTRRTRQGCAREEASACGGYPLASGVRSSARLVERWTRASKRAVRKSLATTPPAPRVPSRRKRFRWGQKGAEPSAPPPRAPRRKGLQHEGRRSRPRPVPLPLCGRNEPHDRLGRSTRVVGASRGSPQHLSTGADCVVAPGTSVQTRVEGRRRRPPPMRGGGSLDAGRRNVRCCARCSQRNRQASCATKASMEAACEGSSVAGGAARDAGRVPDAQRSREPS